ncbi:hypothetical protein ES707_20711 [subsurface metagenome]
MKSHKTVILLLSLAAVGTALVLAAGEAQTPGRPDQQANDAELRMSIIATTRENANETSVFCVTLENAGDKDVVLNLGMMLANGKVHLPAAIRLILTDTNGQSRELHFFDRRYAAVAGRIDDYVVPLRAGSTYTVKLSLDDYWCPETKQFQLKPKPGEYHIRAELTAKGASCVNSDMEGVKLMNFWKGKLQSDFIMVSSQIVSAQIPNSNSTELFKAAQNGHVGQVRKFLARGFSPNIKDDFGRTPLHLAAAHGHKLTAQTLIEQGAKINASDNAGQTALDYAEINRHSGLSQYLREQGARTGKRKKHTRQLKPSLKFKTIAEFEKEIREPAVFLNSEHICFFAPKRREKETRIVFRYLEKAYGELFQIVGVHTEYKIAVYAFPKGNPHGWGGTSNCSIEYDDFNLDFEKHLEWIQYKVPHVSGYIEEIAHNFVHATKAQFGWEMIGWSLGALVSRKVAPNPILTNQIRKTRAGQHKTYTRYIRNGFVFPSDIPANQCDRIHAWILFECEKRYGAGFWKALFQEIRKDKQSLKDAVRLRDGDAIRNARYQITLDCFDRLPGIGFKKRLTESGISLKIDVKSLHPEKPGWNRRLKES